VTDDGTADSAADILMRNVEVRLENNITDDRYYLRSKNVAQPVRNDFSEPQWRITQEFQKKTVYDAARAFTAGSPLLTFSNGATNALTFTLQSGSANVTEYSDPVEGYGIILQNTTWTAWKDATDGTALMATVVNTQATITTAN